MGVQGRPEGKGARLSCKVPDPHQMPIVRARLRNSNLVPADMEGRAIPTVCRLDFDDTLPPVGFETGNVIPGTATILIRGPSPFVGKIIPTKGAKSVLLMRENELLPCPAQLPISGLAPGHIIALCNRL